MYESIVDMQYPTHDYEHSANGNRVKQCEMLCDVNTFSSPSCDIRLWLDIFACSALFVCSNSSPASEVLKASASVSSFLSMVSVFLKEHKNYFTSGVHVTGHLLLKG